MYLKSRGARRPASRPLPTRVEINGPNDHVRRHEAERFVAQSFRHLYGADVREFMPALMSLRADDGLLLGVLGLRPAHEGRLFLECYLDQPVEQLLAATTGGPVDRSGVVEVGNLAVASAGGGRWLITGLTAYLHAARSKWVVFTIGPVLANAFRRLGIRLFDLGPADPSRLSADERASWGRYYDQEPRVMAGLVEEGFHALSRNLDVQGGLTRLWRQAGAAGRIAA
jgi:hypothetical protein